MTRWLCCDDGGGGGGGWLYPHFCAGDGGLMDCIALSLCSILNITDSVAMGADGATTDGVSMMVGVWTSVKLSA